MDFIREQLAAPEEGFCSMELKNCEIKSFFLKLIAFRSPI